MFEPPSAPSRTGGARSIVLASNASLTSRLAPLAGDRHLVRPFVPLAPLLARASAVVHSGAHGTNALALLAGVPSVIVPCIFDQVHHARRQEELGTGVWVRRRRFARRRARRRPRRRRYADRASAFAKTIEAENGTAATAEAAEAMLGGR